MRDGSGFTHPPAKPPPASLLARVLPGLNGIVICASGTIPNKCWFIELAVLGRYVCEKCTELALKVAHYRDMAARIQDELTLDGITRLIAEAIAKMAALHPIGKDEPAP